MYKLSIRQWYDIRYFCEVPRYLEMLLLVLSHVHMCCSVVVQKWREYRLNYHSLTYRQDAAARRMG